MKNLYFFIGTEAELMKMFKVILEAKSRGYNCKLISNGQNLIEKSPFLKLADSKIDIDLTLYAGRGKVRSLPGYLKWFLRTLQLGKKVLRKEMIKERDNENILVVHGDTLSTLMGSRIAHGIGMRYVHVEAGLRSFNWLSPFPEEIDRFFSSLHAEVVFCPKKEYAEYAAKRFKGKAVNTVYNTGIETVFKALDDNQKRATIRIIEDKYFVFVIHRQENLLSEKFMNQTVEAISKLANHMKCLFIYHVQTKNAMEKFHIWNKLEEHPNIKIIGTQSYEDFINTIECSEFLVSDGCGNQQEMYYLGKPYLIMRTKVERNSEGLGWNATLFDNDFNNVVQFYKEYMKYKKPRIIPEKEPSKIIVDELDKLFSKV